MVRTASFVTGIGANGPAIPMLGSNEVGLCSARMRSTVDRRRGGIDLGKDASQCGSCVHRVQRRIFRLHGVEAGAGGEPMRHCAREGRRAANDSDRDEGTIDIDSEFDAGIWGRRGEHAGNGVAQDTHLACDQVDWDGQARDVGALMCSLSSGGVHHREARPKDPVSDELGYWLAARTDPAIGTRPEKIHGC